MELLLVLTIATGLRIVKPGTQHNDDTRVLFKVPSHIAQRLYKEHLLIWASYLPCVRWYIREVMSNL